VFPVRHVRQRVAPLPSAGPALARATRDRQRRRSRCSREETLAILSVDASFDAWEARGSRLI